jgi:hypothetical protein
VGGVGRTGRVIDSGDGFFDGEDDADCAAPKAAKVNNEI